MIRQRTGQSTLEYAVVAAVVVGALLWMQIYMKRGLMGKMQTATDQIGDQFTPRHYTAEYDQSSVGTRKETTAASGASTTEITSPEITKREKGTEDITQELNKESLFE